MEVITRSSEPFLLQAQFLKLFFMWEVFQFSNHPGCPSLDPIQFFSVSLGKLRAPKPDNHSRSDIMCWIECRNHIPWPAVGQGCLHCLKGALLTHIHFAACQGPYIFHSRAISWAYSLHVVQLVLNPALLCSSRHHQSLCLKWCWVMALETGGSDFNWECSGGRPGCELPHNPFFAVLWY